MPDIFTLKPRSSGKEDDPRALVWVCVDDLVIDENIQREVDEARHRIFSADWDWDLAEVPTVTERPASRTLAGARGTLVVTEGQHRVLRRKEMAPGSYLWAVMRAGGGGKAGEAAAAQGIAKGRKSHSALAMWDLRLHAGDPYIKAGDKVLTELGLVMGGTSTATGIWAASAVTGILSGARRTPEEGESLLRATLLTLARAWPDDHAPAARWEATLLRAVAHLIERNAGIIDPRKLTARLNGTASAETWLKRGKERAAGSGSAKWLVLARLLGEAYNNGMRREDRKLTW